MKRIVLIAMVAFAACAEPVPAIEIDAVAPNVIEEGQATSISISGRNFFLTVDSRFDADEPEVHGDYVARVGTRILERATWRGVTLIDATLPSDLTPGTYDIALSAPDGRVSTLTDAIEVVAATDEENGGGSGATPASIDFVSVSLDELLRGGVESTELLVRVLDDDGAGVTGAEVTFSSSVAGGFSAVVDQGDGAYRTVFTPSATASAGIVALAASVSLFQLVASTTVTLVEGCPGSDYVANDWPSFAGAISAANAAAETAVLCVTADAMVSLASSLTVTAPITIAGEARVVLDGGIFPSEDVAIVLLHPEAMVTGITFSSIPGTAVELSGGRVEASRFDACSRAVEVNGDGAVVGPSNVFSNGGGDAVRIEANNVLVDGNLFRDSENDAIEIRGTSESVDIVRNVFWRIDGGVSGAEASNVKVDNNTFVELDGGAVELGTGIDNSVRNNIFVGVAETVIGAPDATFASPPRNNLFFQSQTPCSPCVLGANNLAQDPLLVEPGTGDFRLSVDPPSPCIDAGVDVGLFFSGLAPDLGAYETP